ncbi:MAG: DNA breaking-rejoining enzyme, C-terminal catalytic domain protein [Candidatus Fermentimicrarchaeum limneticum]|uniref:DNA breaking-rejoining enzyme, C-terminal catalytic domain protein n=1 Tax=Fermentimicrarchaeum limneticum TaxID=2795018 RepID=A0A7D5XL64_FERL1|nr:MAG: DNA breaking-rejoining enzyme, C-terminal catalytic domain protein [Candidatus Fermentimicrarchaeum limneticum]QLJ52586.1 MAG: DNA breaking-rejoining enzyme, C-terminal catalytic domain protein [Candidatus Fermentimicrarchaeum limneticum]QLJ52623.1 MAG: DNA breaking-rejoining enzyme, C-terminal catalytic domain protein [Candidatus Fermentimicrarchaeum limneticum]
MALFKKPIPFAINSMEEIFDMGQLLHNPEQRALFYTLYVTGARVSEALAITKRDIWEGEDGGREAYIFKVMTLKKKSMLPVRTLPIPKEGIEGKMAADIWAWRECKDDENAKLFHYSRTRAWNIFSHLVFDIRAITKEREYIELLDFKMHPHYLRHCRATHFAVYHGWSNPYQFMKWFGWDDPKRPMIYIQLNWKDLLKLFPKPEARSDSSMSNSAVPGIGSP